MPTTTKDRLTTLFLPARLIVPEHRTPLIGYRLDESGSRTGPAILAPEHSVILITGKTGAGKTTVLKSMVQSLRQDMKTTIVSAFPEMENLRQDKPAKSVTGLDPYALPHAARNRIVLNALNCLFLDDSSHDPSDWFSRAAREAAIRITENLLATDGSGDQQDESKQTTADTERSRGERTLADLLEVLAGVRDIERRDAVYSTLNPAITRRQHHSILSTLSTIMQPIVKNATVMEMLRCGRFDPTEQKDMAVIGLDRNSELLGLSLLMQAEQPDAARTGRVIVLDGLFNPKWKPVPDWRRRFVCIIKACNETCATDARNGSDLALRIIGQTTDADGIPGILLEGNDISPPHGSAKGPEAATQGMAELKSAAKALHARMLAETTSGASSRIPLAEAYKQIAHQMGYKSWQACKAATLARDDRAKPDDID